MTDPLRVFLAGEGRAELGSQAGDPRYRSDEQPGVIAALLGKVAPGRWKVGGACEWKSIRKLQLRGTRHADTRNVLAVTLDAIEAGCAVLAFTRDCDNDEDREQAVEEGIARAKSELSAAPAVVGGVAVPKLEGWLLALRGQQRTERMSPKKATTELAKAHGGEPRVTDMVAMVMGADLDAVSADASSLQRWLGRARQALLAPAPRAPDGR